VKRITSLAYTSLLVILLMMLLSLVRIAAEDSQHAAVAALTAGHTSAGQQHEAGSVSTAQLAQNALGLAASDAGTLNLNIGGNPLTLDPALSSDTTSSAVIEQLFIGLVDLDDDTAEIRPELATTWTVSPDATVFTFTLRSDATWTDGTAVTAHDVRYGILRSLDPSTGGVAGPLFIIENAQAYNTGAITDSEQVGVTALDDTHLRITLEYPATYALSILAAPCARPMPQWAIEAWGYDWTALAHIVTNGPYSLTQWAVNDHILLDKNPTYYDAGNVQIEHVKMWMMSDAAAWQMYLDGQLDTAAVLVGQTLPPSVAREVHTQPRPSTYYYGFSVSQPPFDSALVRKAFSAAVDRQALIDQALIGAEQPALTYTPPGVFGHVDGYAEGVGLPYNPTQAQGWLSDAGYPGGAGLPPITLWFNTSPGHQRIAEHVRDSWWTTLGVSVTLQDMPWADYLSFTLTGTAQVWRMGWSADYLDANNFLDDGITRSRFGDWSNATYDNLVDQAAREPDPALRQSLYRQAEEILVETDAVMMPLYYYATHIATRPYLQRTYPAAGAFDISTWRRDPAGSTFAFAISGDAATLDPGLTADGNSLLVAAQIYETLVNYESGGTIPVAALAESWSASPDGVTWTFTLTSGITFHDGTDLDAAAVLYNLERWWDPDHPYHDPGFAYFEWLFRGFKGDPDCLISSLATSGTHQVQIVLSEPHSPLLSKLAMPSLGIASPAAIQAGTLATIPVGSGPFEFRQWVPGDRLHLTANAAYQGQGPYLDNMVFRPITNSLQRLSALQSNAVQGAASLALEDVIAASSDPDLQVLWRPSVSIGYVGINGSHSPLDSLLVRQAIAHAIDKQSIIDNLYGITGQVAEQLLPPVLWGHDHDLVDYTYDPVQAQSLLAQAGYTDGFTTTLWQMPVSRVYYPDPDGVAAAMQADLQAVGVTATLVTYDWGTYLDKVRDGEADLFMLGWLPDYMHPDNYLDGILCGGSLGYGPQDDALCDQLQAAREEPDFATQVLTYEWASGRVHDTLPLMPIAHSREAIVLRRNVAGFVPEAVGESFASVFFKPSIGTVTPSSGSGPPGVITYFTTTWQDADGWDDLKQCYFHIADSPSLINNVTLLYNVVKDRLWLRSDDGTVWTGGCSPGSAAAFLENSQARVYCEQTAAQGSGDTLSVTWAIEFKPSFSGTKKLGLKCKDTHKARAKAAWKGTWTITGP
jgi:ABC-type transport system substrate-binding protein